jgi:hypothetical protein
VKASGNKGRNDHGVVIRQLLEERSSRKFG